MADEGSQFEHLKFQHFEVPLVNGKPLELGRGAMGVTYQAHDANLHVPVALKVISPALLADATVRSRFLREARSAAALRHPNVATVVFLGEQEDQVFYAMEFVEGETVADYVKREKGMPLDFALEIAGQVAAALVAAEREGIVHRDLKPANIMLAATDDDEVLVKVIDFGLAKTVDGPSSDASITLTQGGFLGTPLYASPEQLEEREVDSRSDIYSLGVTLFYMLMGHAPFVGSTAQVMSQHLYKDPPWQELEDQPIAALELLRAMLAKDPNDRVPTAAVLRERITDCRARLASTAGGDAAFKRQPIAGDVLNGRYRVAAVECVGDEMLRIEAADSNGEAEVELWMPTTVNHSRDGVVAETRREFASLAKAGVRGVRRVIDEGWVRGRWFVVLEQFRGATLLNAVRAPGSLGVTEFLPGLRQLAEAADRLAELDLPLAGFSLHEVRVAGDPGTFDDLRVDPVRVEGALQGGTLGTISGGTTLPPMGRRGAVKAVGSLAYEVLGGVRLAIEGGSWVPVAELSEGANESLRRAVGQDVAAAGFASAMEFVDALAGDRASGGGARKKTILAQRDAARELVRIDPLEPKSGSAPSVKEPRKPGPLLVPVFIGAAVLLVVALGAWLILGRDAVSTEVAVTASVPTATPKPTSTPTEAEREAVEDQEKFTAARELELANREGAALRAYSELVGSPTVGKGAVLAMEQITGELDVDPNEGLPPEELTQLRGALEVAADQGSASAQQLLGKSLRGRDDREALRWLNAAADQGRVEAMVLAGLMFSNGAGVAAPEMKRAAERFQEAADRKDVNGYFHLAECYRDGLGVERDPARAAELAELAAKDGDERAMTLLGHLYREGEGVKKNAAKALEYFESAVQAGNLPAKSALGVMVMNGEGLDADPERAVALWREGAEAGEPTGMFLYAQSLMDPRFGGSEVAASPWFARAAAAGHAGAKEWCLERGIAIPDPVEN